MSVAGPARAVGDAVLQVTVVGPDGQVDPELGNDYTGAELAAMSEDVLQRTYSGDQGQNPDTYSGVSIAAILRQLPVPPSAVTGVTFVCPGITDVSALSARFHDLDDPAAAPATYPFVDGNPPVFAPYTTGSDASFQFVVNAREPGRGDATVTNGRVGYVAPNQRMTLRVQLGTRVVVPTVTVSDHSVAAGDTVTFTAAVDAGVESPMWTWDFGDGQTVSTGADRTVSHTYGEPGGDLTARVSVTGTNGFEGISEGIPIHVTGTPPTTTPPPDPPPGGGAGTGGSSAPISGPATGDGPRVGGGSTSRTGGRAGPSFDPRSSQPSISAGSTDGAPQDGDVVGYLLSDGAVVAAPRAQNAAVPQDDSAPAARNGTTAVRLSGWVGAVAVVVALLALGAGSERRRPTTTRARRKR